MRLHKEVGLYVNESNSEEAWTPVATLLDINEGYPRVNRPIQWSMLRKYGIKQKSIRLLKGLQVEAEHRVRGREENSDSWRPLRGLREGCAMSPILFNISHSAVTRQAAEERVKLHRKED